MLSEHRNTPKPILKILAEEPGWRFTNRICAASARRNKDFLSVPGKSVIEFVVLITDEVFIVEPDLLEDFLSKHRVAGPLCVTLIGWVSMFGIPDPDRVRHDRGHGTPKKTAAYRLNRPTDAADFGVFVKKLHAGPKIVAGIFSMRAQNCNVSTTRCANAAVHRAGRHSMRIIDDTQLRMLRSKARQHVSSAVARKPVHDNNLQPSRWPLLLEDRAYGHLDVIFLVKGWNDYRNHQFVRATGSGHWSFMLLLLQYMRYPENGQAQADSQSTLKQLITALLMKSSVS